MELVEKEIRQLTLLQQLFLESDPRIQDVVMQILYLSKDSNKTSKETSIFDIRGEVKKIGLGTQARTVDNFNPIETKTSLSKQEKEDIKEFSQLTKQEQILFAKVKKACQLDHFFSSKKYSKEKQYNALQKIINEKERLLKEYSFSSLVKLCDSENVPQMQFGKKGKTDYQSRFYILALKRIGKENL